MTHLERAERWLAKAEPAVSGQNGHGTLLRVTSSLLNGFNLTSDETLDLLQRFYNHRCLPAWSETELRHKIAESIKLGPPAGKQLGWLSGDDDRPKRLKSATTFEQSILSLPSQTDVLDNVRALIGDREMSEADLWEASHIRLDWPSSEDFQHLLQFLYEPGERINYVVQYNSCPDGKCRPRSCGDTVERNHLIQRLQTGWRPQCEAGGWLRMNPVDGHGVADSNVIHFRFLLIEADHLNLPLQMALLCCLPIPLVLIMRSGRTSLHGWVRISAGNQEEYTNKARDILETLAPFGIDPKNKNPSRLSRLPGGVRKADVKSGNDGAQRILYMNPAACFPFSIYEEL